MPNANGIVKLSCVSTGSSAKASSTWKHDTRKFGPQNALNSESDAAWKSAPSEESDPLAYYEVYFNRPVSVHEIRLQCQGGFVGMDCIVYTKQQQKIADGSAQQNNDEVEWEEFEDLFVDPIDSNETQIFPVEMDSDENESNHDACTALRIEFGRSTDFYGRIVVYSFEVWGLEAPKQDQGES